VALRSALGRVLASDVIAPFNVPAHDNSAMDGYALRHADLVEQWRDAPARRSVRRWPARLFAGAVAAGECVRIMTGALPPAGCDTVVMQEVVELDGDQRRRSRPASARPEYPPGGRGPGAGKPALPPGG
jgi:molybdopterin molybdotransferase